MDPLSITAGTVAFVSATIATGKIVKKLIDLRKAPVEIYQLHNEVSDVTLVLAKAEYLEMVLQKKSHDNFLRHLRILRQRAENDLQRLDGLLKDHIIENYPQLEASNWDEKVHQVKFSKKGWMKYAGKAGKLRQSLCNHRKSMDEAMNQLHASALPHTMVKLDGLKIMTTEVREMLQTNQNTSTEHLQVTQENILPSLANIQSGMQRLLESRITSEMAKALKNSPGEEAQGESIQYQQSNIAQADQEESNQSTPTQQQPNPLGESIGMQGDSVAQLQTPSVSSSTLSVFTTLYAPETCDPFCGCQCHKLSVARFPPWMGKILGCLFVGYSGIPYIQRRRCNEKMCKQEAEILIKVTYYFPTWFLARMVTIIDRWNSIDGHDIFLKSPRIVSSSSEIFVMAQKGNIRGLQEIFDQRQASIYDVSEGEGRTALHFALTAKRAEVCAFLLSQRISLLTEDKNMLSPIDLVWNYLLQDDTTEENKAIRGAFASLLDESDDLLKRGFSPLHRIIFGLSKVSLEDHLQLSTADVDMRCSLGRTPLCWAALRRDANHVRSLVRFGARIDLSDIRGQSPFHFAAETGVFESLKILLEVAAKLDGPQNQGFPQCRDDEKGEKSEKSITEEDPSRVSAFCLELMENRDYKGRTPLHFATRVNHIEHASLLLRYGADVDSPDTPLGRPPIFLAIYWNSHEVLSLLLSKNARTDIMDTRKCTVLHYAARFADAKTLGILCGVSISGISPECMDCEGRTPLEAFDADRPSYVAEELDVVATNRKTFENLLRSVKLNFHSDSDQSDLDSFFDAASSLEASIASLPPIPLVDDAINSIPIAQEGALVH